jgi:hypothetical protein
MTENTSIPQNPTEQADALTTELGHRRWRVVDGDWTGLTRTEVLISPHGPLTLSIEAAPEGVSLAFDAPQRTGDRFCYAWQATTPILPADLIDAVALAAEADATFPFDENDAVGLDFLADAGWRPVHGDTWISSDGARVFETRLNDPADAFPIRIRPVPAGRSIRLSQHVSAQVLAALTAPDPAPVELPDTMTVRVRDEAAESRAWGHGGGAPVFRTVTISAFCPLDGQRRGTPHSHRFADDGDWYNVDRWDNPCGHTDYYAAVLAEATARNAAAAEAEARA